MNPVKKLWNHTGQGFLNAEHKVHQAAEELKALLKDRSGDQITGWLIVVLLVVVCGAVFLNLYQSSIQEIWAGIITKMKSVFGL